MKARRMGDINDTREVDAEEAWALRLWCEPVLANFAGAVPLRPGRCADCCSLSSVGPAGKRFPGYSEPDRRLRQVAGSELERSEPSV